MLRIDNEEWSGKVIVEAIGEDFETVFDGSEEYTQDGRLYSGDPVGTRYGHRVTVRRDPEVSAAEWDRFYKLISAPVSAHVVELPHDQGTVIYEAKIRSGSRPSRQDDKRLSQSRVSASLGPRRRASHLYIGGGVTQHKSVDF